MFTSEQIKNFLFSCRKLPIDRLDSDLLNIITLIKHTRYFSQLTSIQKKLFASVISLKLPLGREPILEYNKLCCGIYFILDGKIGVYINSSNIPDLSQSLPYSPRNFSSLSYHTDIKDDDSNEINNNNQMWSYHNLPNPSDIIRPKTAAPSSLGQQIKLYMQGDTFGFNEMLNNTPNIGNYISLNVTTVCGYISKQDYLDIIFKTAPPGRLKPLVINALSDTIKEINLQIDAETESLARYEVNGKKEVDLHESVLRKAAHKIAAVKDIDRIPPKFIEICSKSYYTRTEADVKYLLKIIEQIPFFYQFNDETCLLFCRIIGHVMCEESTLLFAQGDPGNLIYVSLSGSVSVHLLEGRDAKPTWNCSEKRISPEVNIEKVFGKCVDVLGSKTAFGEAAFLEAANKRTATIITRQQTHFICFDRISFEKVVRRHLLADVVIEDSTSHWDKLVSERTPQDIRLLIDYLKSLPSFQQYTSTILFNIAEKCWNVKYDALSEIPKDKSLVYFIVAGTVNRVGIVPADSAVFVVGDKFEDSYIAKSLRKMSGVVSETMAVRNSNALTFARRASRLFASSGGISFRAGTDINLIALKASDFDLSLSQDAQSIFTDKEEFKKPLMMAPALRDNTIHTKLLPEIAKLPFFANLPYSVTSRVSRLFMFQNFAAFHTIFHQNSNCDKFYLSIILRGCVAIHCNKSRLPFENVVSEENKLGDCIAILSRNDFIGDLNIYHDRFFRGVSAVCLEKTEVLCIDIVLFKTLYFKHHSLNYEKKMKIPVETIIETIEGLDRSKATLEKLYPILDNCPLFRNCSSTIKSILVESLQFRSVPPKSMISQQDLSNKEIIFILKGNMTIHVNGTNENLKNMHPLINYSDNNFKNDYHGAVLGYLFDNCVQSPFPEEYFTVEHALNIISHRLPPVNKKVASKVSLVTNSTVELIFLPLDAVWKLINTIPMPKIIYYFPSLVQSILSKKESDRVKFDSDVLIPILNKFLKIESNDSFLGTNDLFDSFEFITAPPQVPFLLQDKSPPDSYLILSGSATIFHKDAENDVPINSPGRMDASDIKKNNNMLIRLSTMSTKQGLQKALSSIKMVEEPFSPLSSYGKNDTKRSSFTLKFGQGAKRSSFSSTSGESPDVRKSSVVSSGGSRRRASVISQEESLVIDDPRRKGTFQVEQFSNPSNYFNTSNNVRKFTPFITDFSDEDDEDNEDDEEDEDDFFDSIGLERVYGPKNGSLNVGDIIKAGRCTVVPMTEMKILKIDQSTFMKHDIRKQLEDTTKFAKYLQTMPLFRMFSSDQLFYFATNFEKHNYCSKSLIIKKGQKVDGLFYIESGNCSIWMAKSDFSSANSPIKYLTELNRSQGPVQATLFSNASEIVSVGPGMILGDIEVFLKDNTFCFPYFLRADSPVIVRFLPRSCLIRNYNPDSHFNQMKLTLLAKTEFWKRCIERGENYASKAAQLPPLNLAEVLKLGSTINRPLTSRTPRDQTKSIHKGALTSRN